MTKRFKHLTKSTWESETERRAQLFWTGIVAVSLAVTALYRLSSPHSTAWEQLSAQSDNTPVQSRSLSSDLSKKPLSR